MCFFFFLDEDFREGIGSSRGDKRLTRMEGHVENGFVEFLAVRSDFLHARFVLQVPQSDAAIVTCKDIENQRQFSQNRPNLVKILR